MRRQRTRILVLGAATISAMVVATDWPLQFLTGFWSEHALLGGVVSGLVLLIIGTLIVERYLESQDANRWRRISGIAYQELASNQLAAYRTLVVASVGRRNAADVYEFPYQEWEPVVDDLLLGNGLTANGRPARTLNALARDAAWLALGYQVVRDLDESSRDVIARWAPVLIQTDDLYRGLDLVSVANDSVHRLRSVLRHALRALDASQDPRVAEASIVADSPERLAHHARQVEEAWMDALRAVLQARDDLFSLLGKKNWSNPGWRTLEP